MLFDLAISRREFAMQEPVMLTFSLTSPDAAVMVPLHYSTTDAITVSVYDSTNTLISSATGYDALQRTQEEPVNILDQNELTKVELPAGKTLIWEQNLLSFVSVPGPGTYFIEAVFNFSPSAIAATSPRAELTIMETATRYCDIVTDHICITETYLLQCSSIDSEQVIAPHVAGPGIFPAWRSGRLSAKTTAPALVAKADFADHTSFEYDLYRPFAWIDGNELVAAFFSTDSGEARILFRHPVPAACPALFGRPVFHKDGSISVYISLPELPQKPVRKLTFSSQGALAADTTLAELDYIADPVSGTADWEGNSYRIFGNAGGLPIRIMTESSRGKVSIGTLLTEEQLLGLFMVKPDPFSIRVMAIHADIGADAAPDTALLALILIEDEKGRTVQTIRIPWNMAASSENTVRIDSPLFKSDLLKAGERIISGDIIQLPHGATHSVLISDTGTVFYSGAKDAYSVRLAVPSTGLSAVRLCKGQFGNLYLVHPVAAKGLASTLLYAVPRP